MTPPPVKIKVENVFKVFGPRPQAVMDQVRAGISKADLLEQTGHVVGIRDVSLDIPAARTFVVMGLSGSGKSTLIRHFNRLIEPTAGRIVIDGTDVLELSASGLRDFRRSKTSMVFQRFGLLPHKSVLDNVVYGLVINGMARKQAREKAMEQIDLVGLAGFEQQYPRQLSGGMQQRVGLARALATDAEILLMDEAFSALDPLIRNDMQRQLKELQARLHKTIVFITHDLDEALQLGDEIAILKDGELRQVGTGEEILLNPADDYVERFVRDVNRARVVTIGSIARQAATLPLDAVTRGTLARRLEHSDDGVVFLLGPDNRVAAAILRGEFHSTDHHEDSWWRNPDNHAVPVVVGADQVIEDILPLLAINSQPLAIARSDGTFLGSLSRGAAINALTTCDRPGIEVPHR